MPPSVTGRSCLQVQTQETVLIERGKTDSQIILYASTIKGKDTCGCGKELVIFVFRKISKLSIINYLFFFNYHSQTSYCDLRSLVDLVDWLSKSFIETKHFLVTLNKYHQVNLLLLRFLQSLWDLTYTEYIRISVG